MESLFNKITGRKVCNFIKKRFQYRCFPVKFRKFLRTPFSTERLWWLLLEGVCKETSLVKIMQSCHFNIFGINHGCFRKMSLRKIMNKRDCWNVYRFSCLFLLWGEWRSGLERFIQNQEVSGWNPTACLAGLWDPTLLQTSWWPSGWERNINSDWLTLGEWDCRIIIGPKFALGQLNRWWKNNLIFRGYCKILFLATLPDSPDILGQGVMDHHQIWYNHR